MNGQIDNIKLQLKNIDSQFNIFEMQNKSMMGAINQKSQIMNIGIQILNIGIQTLNYANTLMAQMGENINDLENQIQEITKQLDNMYPKNSMMNMMMMNNMGMGMMNNNRDMDMMNNNKNMGNMGMMNNNMGMGMMNNNMGMGLMNNNMNMGMNQNPMLRQNLSDSSDDLNLSTGMPNPIFKIASNQNK